jgi:hypothetical protein
MARKWEQGLQIAHPGTVIQAIEADKMFWFTQGSVSRAVPAAWVNNWKVSYIRQLLVSGQLHFAEPIRK